MCIRILEQSRGRSAGTDRIHRLRVRGRDAICGGLSETRITADGQHAGCQRGSLRRACASGGLEHGWLRIAGVTNLRISGEEEITDDEVPNALVAAATCTWTRGSKSGSGPVPRSKDPGRR